MTSLAESHFDSMFPQQHEGDDFACYPEPPQSMFTSGATDMPLTTDAFGFRGDEMFPTPTPGSMGFEASLYPETPNYILNNSRGSPAVYPEDSDMRLPSSSLSSASAPSAASSAIGSPQSNPVQTGNPPEWAAHGLGLRPTIVNGTDFISGTEYSSVLVGPGMEEFAFEYPAQNKNFVDPWMIHPNVEPPRPITMTGFRGPAHFQASANALSPSISSSPQPNMIRHDSSSPFLQNGTFHPGFPDSPYAAPPMDASVRQQSMSIISPNSGEYTSGDETKEKQRCADCGKVFKDLKAHMLTHQNERPEKCPIQNCEYHIKGFARKYDKNRHTLTHYKGTMVCGFCPGSGSAVEKSFNRADVFKRHLTAVHGVEQTPPNSRKKTPTGITGGKKITGYAPDATGKCSTCSQTFSNAQDFYEHLDDCVLRIVQQEDPAEAINAQRLAEVENDQEVHQTLEKNNLPITTQTSPTEEDDDDLEMGDDEDGDNTSRSTLSPTSKKKTNPAGGVQKSRGMTHSRGGVALNTKTRGRKNRRDYPLSWGFDKGRMTLKKRVLCCFDGPRRLAKDDMMLLSTDQMVRIKLSDGESYITDLDAETMRRAEGFHGATDDEKGPWLSDDPTEEQLKEMHALLETSTAAM